MPSSACSCSLRDLHSFPTRRSSDLNYRFDHRRSQQRVSHTEKRQGMELLMALLRFIQIDCNGYVNQTCKQGIPKRLCVVGKTQNIQDRKSTRLNSSHSQISYAVFCLLLQPPRSTLFPYTTLFRSEL